MRIAVFTDSFLPYICGATFAALNQANALAALGHEVRIYCPGSPHNQPQSSTSEELHESITVKTVPFSLPWGGQPDLNVVFPILFPTLRDLRRFGPDVVHIHTEWGTGWAGLIGARRLKVPAVGTFHTFWNDPRYVRHFPWPNWRIVRWAMGAYSAFFYRRCDDTIAPSAAVQRHLDHLDVEAAIVSNGMPQPEPVAATDIAGLRERYGLGDRFTFLYLGRVSYEKSLPLCLQAFRTVLADHPESRFVFIGDGPEMPHLKAVTRSLRLQEQVVFTGAVPHEELMATNLPRIGDVFVTASETENQPVSLLEGMRFGLPVIGPRARGIPELIKPEQNGLLFEPGDVDTLAAHMTRLASDASLRQRLATGALATGERHGIERTAHQLEAIYHEARSASGLPKAARGRPAGAANAAWRRSL